MEATSTDVISLVRRWVEEVWNEGRLDRLDDFHPAEFQNEGQPSTIEEARAWHERSRASFPDVRYTIEEIVAAGERVAMRWTAEGTHLGTLWGMIPPTGRRVRWRGMHMLRVEGGRITDVWAVTDNAERLQQIGVTLRMPGEATFGDARSPDG